MKQRLADALVGALLACALFVAAPLSAQTPQSGWKKYTYSNDSFAISTPSEPVFRSQVTPTDSGNIDLHLYTITVGESSVVMISSSEVKGPEKDSTKARLQKAKEGALKAGNATLTSEKEIALGGYPGLQYAATTDKLQVRGRMYIVQNKLIQILEIAPISVTIPADADRIVDSITLLPAK